MIAYKRRNFQLDYLNIVYISIILLESFYVLTKTLKMSESIIVNDEVIHQTSGVILEADKVDNLKRYDVSAKSKYPKVSCTICGKLMIRNNLTRHMKVHNVSQNSDLSVSESRDEVSKKMNDQKNIFNKKLKLGEHVHGVLLEGDVEPMSLSKEYREALELFECYNSDVQITSILKP